MKLSTGFWSTYKEVPADAEIPSHQLMIRAGLLHKSGAGLYSYLPFCYRTIRKVEQIIREEMNKVGCHEILMSVVTPGELWKETGRWDKMGDQMLKFKDKGERDLCISPTNEEAIADIFRKSIKSYKQLPVSLYQINTKFRDEIRPRFGLMRGREFTMKDAYSFHIDKESMDEVYENMFKAYEAIFKRMGLEFSAVEADGGAIVSGDAKTHEFQVIADTGEDEIIYCAKTNYAANIEKAKTKRANLEFNSSSEEINEIETKDMSTIEDVCNFLKISKHHSLKTLVYKIIKDDEEKFVLAVLLGDDSLNELKLLSELGADQISAATDNDLKSLSLQKGFIGPQGQTIEVLFDQAIDLGKAYTAGANKKDFHIQNLIPSRDIKEIKTADLRTAMKGDSTWDGKGLVEIKRGIEVGHIFQLGDQYTKAMGVTVTDNNGKGVSPLMGCYGIGVTRTVAAAIEQNFDDKGIVWPKEIAPYQIYFAVIAKSDEYKELAEKIYQDLLGSGLEVVYDDRKAGAGFKFKDADLLGLPLQLVLGERDHKEDGMLEIRIRKTGEKIKVKTDEAINKLQELLKEIE